MGTGTGTGTEIQTTTKNELETTTMTDLGISTDDVLIPKLLLMQNTSESVGEGKAKLGDILNSQTLEIMGGVDSPLEIIPLKVNKVWVIKQLIPNSKPKFLRTEQITARNEKLPWEGEENGMQIRRDYTMDFFVLVKKEVDKGEAFPCVVRFTRTGVEAGKQLATQMFKLSIFKKPVFALSAMLGVKKEKFEQNYYTMFQITKGKEVDAKTQEACVGWTKLLSSMAYKIDDTDEVAEQHAKTVINSNTNKKVFSSGQEDLPF